MLQVVIYKQLVEMEDGFQIDIYYQILVLWVDFGDVVVQLDFGVIYQNVGFVQFVDIGGKQIFLVLFVREIGFDCDDFYVCVGFYCFDQLFGMFFFMYIGKVDIDVFFGERKNKFFFQVGCVVCYDGCMIC